MKYLIIMLMGLCAGCDKCPETPPEKPGIYSKILGTVEVDKETCTIYETYEKYDCKNRNFNPATKDICEGQIFQCEWKVLTRLTKCPSGSHVNTVGKTNDKFSHETVE